MAVSKVPFVSKLILKVQVGLNASGKAAYKQRVFAGLKAAAVDDDVFTVAQEMGSLQKYTPFEVLRLGEDVLAKA